MDNNTESIPELLANQRQLQREEDFIIRTLSKIDKQLHALQVEQLHLLNRMNTETTSTPAASTTHTNSKCLSNNENDSIENILKELDLTIPSSTLSPEEEVEEDEDD
ncbi:snRNA-activating protein complex subunit 5 [Cephus cinctus]|uniref:snRNA-activating protein complex subunit 5 n=1 Tax=Cephus cinctus TaxID=211228 RepID=A0AAJ7FNG1_CEPCN|nr:snRNA-activating protein complex subunit 5 [Cephus cinctus]